MDLLDLFVKVEVDDRASDKITTLSDKLGRGLETAAKIGTAAVTAASTAVGALLKQSIDAYAEYEQLVGGVDTLLGDSSQKLQEYAARAYKTATVSTNEYMDLATSFAASLLRGLEGDTNAAAELTDMAIQDISDNANKFGKDITLIQTAYRNFAKEQYMLLDNLSLGFAGTSKGMFDLLTRAAELNEEFAATAEFSLDEKGHLEAEFNDIIKAINIVQQELGVTGTTALEASTTISGSVNMAKAAWTNLLVGIADENQDFELLMDQFVETIVGTTNESGETVGGVLNNILPRVRIALDGIGTLVETALPVIMEHIPSLITDFLPKIVSAGAGIVKALGKGIYENGGDILDLFFGLVDDVLGVLKNGDGITTFLNGGMEIVDDILDGIIEAIPNLVDAALGIVDGLVGFFGNKDNIEKLAEGALEIVTKLAEEFPGVVSHLLGAALDLIGGLVGYLSDPENLKDLEKAGKAIVDALGNAIAESVIVLADHAIKLVQSTVAFIEETRRIREGENMGWMEAARFNYSLIEAGTTYDDYLESKSNLPSDPLEGMFPDWVKVTGRTRYGLLKALGIDITDTASSDNIPIFGMESIGTQRFNGGTINDNSTTSTTTVGEINTVINNYSTFSDEELAEMLARQLQEELAR